MNREGAVAKVDDSSTKQQPFSYAIKTENGLLRVRNPWYNKI